MRPKVKLLAALALVLSAGLVYAGIKDRHVNQFPVAADFSHKPLILFMGGSTTADRAPAMLVKFHEASVISGIRASVGTMSGVITGFTADVLKNGTMSCLRSAIDLYSTGLASVKTVHEGTLLNEPCVFAAGDTVQVNLVIGGSDTPTGSDIVVQLDRRPFVGEEQ